MGMLYTGNSGYTVAPVRAVGSPADQLLRQAIAWASPGGTGSTTGGYFGGSPSLTSMPALLAAMLALLAFAV